MADTRAVIQHGYGDSEVLRLGTVPIPEPGRREVLLRVQAAAIDRGTWHLMTGKPRVARLALGLRAPRRVVPGLDVAGVVEATGPDVTTFRPGQAVFGIAKGSLAEHAIADVAKLAPAPPSLAPEQAAALGVSGLTALQALDAGRVSTGSTVLVIGASGGVGSLAVAIAVLRGASVTAVCSGAKADVVRAWGARRVLDHCRDEMAGDTSRYDAVLDIAGSTPLARLRELATPTGAIVFVGQETGGEWTGGYGAPMRRAVRMLGRRQRYVMLVARERAVDLERLADLVEHEGLRPHLHATYPFAEVRAAMDALAGGAVCGKVALVPS